MPDNRMADGDEHYVRVNLSLVRPVNSDFNVSKKPGGTSPPVYVAFWSRRVEAFLAVNTSAVFLAWLDKLHQAPAGMTRAIANSYPGSYPKFGASQRSTSLTGICLRRA